MNQISSAVCRKLRAPMVSRRE